MEDTAIIDLWKAYDKKLDEHLVLDRRNAEDITKVKVKSLVASMQPLKVFTILMGIVWVGFVDMLIVGAFYAANPLFLISAGIQVLLTKLAIGIYLYQLILIRQVDINGPILAVQERLARLRSSTIWSARLLFLQLPVWTTFYWNKSMLENGNAGLYLLQAVVTLSFAFVAVWLFRNIRYENRNKKWFRLIFNGMEWEPVIRSMELLSEVEEYNTTHKD